MIVELLFNEVCGLYGDSQNAAYLKATLSGATFIETPITDDPYFVCNTPDLIYIGSMSENTQRQVIEKLMPYKERILELIDQNVVILATGNAGEIFCNHIDYVTEGLTAQGLGIFDINVKTNLFDRYNGKVLGQYEDLTIVGFRSQFSFLYGDNTKNYFVKCQRGDGINRESKLEGLQKNNLFITQILGPILALNPLFCEHLIRLTGNEATAAYKEAAMDAYHQRIKEFSDPNTIFGKNK